MTPRILLFSTTSSHVGGVETWLDRCCEHLSQQGFDPVVGLARGQKFNDPDRFRQFHTQLNTIEVDGRGLNSEGRIRALMRSIRKVQPAIVMPMSLVEANNAAIRCKQQGDDLRLVIHAQGNLPAMLADLKHYEPGIDHVVCPGKLTRKFLTSWGGFGNDYVTHIPNGADVATTSRTHRDSCIRLGYVGRFTRGDKRVLDLIDLHRELTNQRVDFHLSIVGDGPARTELHAAFDSIENVTLPGPMSHSELYNNVFPKLDALVLCSASEAFGIALAEAMMNGVVPITSQYLGYHSEQLVVHEKTGLSYAVGDMAMAADQVKRLVDEPQLLPELSTNSKKHALENYTWKRSLDEWSSLLREVAMTAPRPIPKNMETTSSSRGTLESLKVPSFLIDFLRRSRRFVFGSAVPAGGEEWPLFRRVYSDECLHQVAQTCADLDQPVTEISPTMGPASAC